MNYLIWERISDNPDLLIHQFNNVPTVRKTGAKRSTSYFNIPVSFDIETSSWYEHGEKRAAMYEWSFAVGDLVIIGREWEEYFDLLQILHDNLKLNDGKRIIIWVHNLSYEFTFLAKRHQWGKIFAMNARKPVYAKCMDLGIEYRCSYLLTGYSLAKLAEQIRENPLPKMVGDLDYSKIRHSNTAMTEKEIQYCVHDVLIVTRYIQQCIEDEHNNIADIPITKTSYVRRSCRAKTLYGINGQRYYNMIQDLTLTPEIYQQLRRAFAGGFTHASPWNVGKICRNVSSYDECSAYPAMMVAKKYPVSAGRRIEITSKEQFEDCMNKYCCLFDVELKGVESRFLIDHPLSYSKCRAIPRVTENGRTRDACTLDNGRIVCADSLETTVTDVDFSVLKKYYKWTSCKIYNFTVFDKGYLPTDFVKYILQLYKDKTSLKGVAGKEVEYASAKAELNSLYGMCVTDIVRPEWIYNAFGEWISKVPNMETEIHKVNYNRNRFIFYAWGVWVTAYARQAILAAVLNIGLNSKDGCDYIYSDTDSVKIMHKKEHQAFFDTYNKMILWELEQACKHHKISADSIRPKNKKGVEKPLGVFELENSNPYPRFKTLGAKRYMYSERGVLHITISGVAKSAAKHLQKTYGIIGAMHHFDDGLTISGKDTGKSTHTYIDYETIGIVQDYKGQYAQYHELTSIHMEAADYSLSMLDAYMDYLQGVQEEIK